MKSKFVLCQPIKSFDKSAGVFFNISILKDNNKIWTMLKNQQTYLVYIKVLTNNSYYS